MSRSHNTVHVTHETDAAANGMVATWFARGWVLIPQTARDYHIDYKGQPTSAGELTGDWFCVQQKASQNLPVSHGNVSAQIGAKSLLYYIQKERLPVFLFAVDVNANKGAGTGYFIFLQELIEHKWSIAELSRLAAQKKKKLVVQVPVANLITNHASLRIEVARALAYMRKKHPGELADAVAAEKKRLTEIDGRWHYDVSIHEGIKHITLQAISDVSLKVTLGPEHIDALKRHWELGTGASFAGGLINVQGSPLFDSSLPLKLSFGQSGARQGEYRFWSTEHPAFSFSLPYQGTSGTNGLNLVCEWPDAPFVLNLVARKDAMKEGTVTFTSTINWNIERWFNISVLRLPYYQQTSQLLFAFIDGRTVHHELQYKGNRLAAGTFDNPEPADFFELTAFHLEVVGKLRTICEQCSKDITFGEIIWESQKALESLDYAYAILLKRTIVIKNTKIGGSIACHKELNKDDIEGRKHIVEHYDSQGKRANHRFCREEKRVIGGVEIDLGPVEVDLRNCIFTVIEPSRSAFIRGDSDDFTIAIAGDESTTASFCSAHHTETPGEPNT